MKDDSGTHSGSVLESGGFGTVKEGVKGFEWFGSGTFDRNDVRLLSPGAAGEGVQGKIRV